MDTPHSLAMDTPRGLAMDTLHSLAMDTPLGLAMDTPLGLAIDTLHSLMINRNLPYLYPHLLTRRDELLSERGPTGAGLHLPLFTVTLHLLPPQNPLHGR